MTHGTNPPPKAPGAFAAELCATLIARHPFLAALLQPLLDYIRRTTEAFERILDALRAGQFALPATAAPAARSAPERPHSVRTPTRHRAPRAPRPSRATQPTAPATAIPKQRLAAAQHQPSRAAINTPPAPLRFFWPLDGSGRIAPILFRYRN